MLLHRKLSRVALGRIPVLAATLMAFQVSLRMPQTCPCCRQRPWEQELSHKSLKHATAPFSSCHSSFTHLPHTYFLICCSVFTIHIDLSAKTQAEIISSEHREGQNKDPEALHRSRGGEK